MTEVSGFGVLEVFHAGAWGSFCDGDVGRFDYLSTVPSGPFSNVRSFQQQQPPPTPPTKPLLVTLQRIHAMNKVVATECYASTVPILSTPEGRRYTMASRKYAFR